MSRRMANQCVKCCKGVFGWIPVVFIVAIIAWSYYAYVLQLCIFTVPSIAEKVIYLILYHPLLFLFLWSYFKTTFAPIGRVPDEFSVSESEHAAYVRATSDDEKKEVFQMKARTLPIMTFTASGAVRYCEKCKSIKPDRAHHCSMCNTCVLKMDHHCPWVNNCVGYSSYKFFVLFLGYAELYCLYVAFTTLKYFIEFWTKGGFSGDYSKFHILFLFFVAFMFGVSLTFLFGYHLYLISKNKSTLESFRAPHFRSGADKNGFNLGCGENLREVFGDSAKLWCFPIASSRGDGVQYPLRLGTAQANASYNATAQANGSYGSLSADDQDRLIRTNGTQKDNPAYEFRVDIP